MSFRGGGTSFIEPSKFRENYRCNFLTGTKARCELDARFDFGDRLIVAAEEQEPACDESMGVGRRSRIELKGLAQQFNSALRLARIGIGVSEPIQQHIAAGIG